MACLLSASAAFAVASAPRRATQVTGRTARLVVCAEDKMARNSIDLDKRRGRMLPPPSARVSVIASSHSETDNTSDDA